MKREREKGIEKGRKRKKKGKENGKRDRWIEKERKRDSH